MKNKYKVLAKIGEGTFSDVVKAENTKTGSRVAIKCIKGKLKKNRVELNREVNCLRRLANHKHIVQLIEVLQQDDEPSQKAALVLELMDKNLYELFKERKSYIKEPQAKKYIFQLLKALDHMHKNGLFHRDIKPENILLQNDNIKLADFGSCKQFPQKKDKEHTEYVSTRWYRSPECLLTKGVYDYKMDIWGVGCVFFEILSLQPLFPGKTEVDQVHRIHKILGTPDLSVFERFKMHPNDEFDYKFAHQPGTGIQHLLPNISEGCSDFIIYLLTYDADKRPTCHQALRHPYFAELFKEEQFNKSQYTQRHSPMIMSHKSEHSLLGQSYDNFIKRKSNDVSMAEQSFQSKTLNLKNISNMDQSYSGVLSQSYLSMSLPHKIQKTQKRLKIRKKKGLTKGLAKGKYFPKQHQQSKHYFYNRKQKAKYKVNREQLQKINNSSLEFKMQKKNSFPSIRRAGGFMVDVLQNYKQNKNIMSSRRLKNFKNKGQQQGHLPILQKKVGYSQQSGNSPKYLKKARGQSQMHFQGTSKIQIKKLSKATGYTDNSK